MTTFFAIEILPHVSVHQMAGMFCGAAKRCKKGVTSFSQLESLGVIEINACRFMRFRSDIQDPRLPLQHLLAQGHGVAYKTPDGFAFYRGLRTGKVSTSLLVASPVRNPQSWQGPKVKGWEQQFTVTP